MPRNAVLVPIIHICLIGFQDLENWALKNVLSHCLIRRIKVFRGNFFSLGIFWARKFLLRCSTVFCSSIMVFLLYRWWAIDGKFVRQLIGLWCSLAKQFVSLFLLLRFPISAGEVFYSNSTVALIYRTPHSNKPSKLSHTQENFPMHTKTYSFFHKKKTFPSFNMKLINNWLKFYWNRMNIQWRVKNITKETPETCHQSEFY